ncbi:MAG: diacylglycerol kinase family lipid kinase [Leptolinea sp.]|nr:diacylglycerol kinase family lipid kinase [Leptolinea sp.]
MHHKPLMIFNPIANLGRAWPVASNLRRVADEFGGAVWAGTVYPGHASEIAEKAASEGYKTVVAVGGDGTIHEVINGLMKVDTAKRPLLGIVPVGSGNDFAGTMGIPRDSEEALRKVFSGSPRRIDIASALDGNGRKEYWMNTLGMGFDSAVNFHSREVPIFQGFMIYFLALFRTIIENYRPFKITGTIDGESFEKETLMLTVTNGKREGGGFLLAPDALQDDGLLNYTLVDVISRLKMLMAIPYFLKGTHASLNYVKTGTFKNISLKSNNPLWIHADGEIFAGFSSQVTELTLEVLPGAIELIL